MKKKKKSEKSFTLSVFWMGIQSFWGAVLIFRRTWINNIYNMSMIFSFLYCIKDYLSYFISGEVFFFNFLFFCPKSWHFKGDRKLKQPIKSSCWSSKALLCICDHASAFTNRLFWRDRGTTILRNSNHLQSHILADCSSTQLHCFHFHSERKKKTRFLNRNQGQLLVLLFLLWILDVGEKINFSYPKRVCISIFIQWLCLLPFCLIYLSATWKLYSWLLSCTG